MTASERRTTEGRADSASATPGFGRAKDSSMPEANIVVMSEEPPEDTSGSGTPMTGSRPITAPMLMIAWMTIQAMMPAVAIRTKRSFVRVTSR